MTKTLVPLLVLLWGWCGAAIAQPNTEPPEFRYSWGGRGTINGAFSGAYGIAADRWGQLYVADGFAFGLENNRVQKFTGWGVHRLTIGGPLGTCDSGHLSGYLHGVAVDRDSNVYVTYGTGFVSVFSSQGQFLLCENLDDILPDPDVFLMGHIDVDSLGFIYLTDPWNNRWAKIAPNWTLVYVRGSNGTGPGQFDSPYGIAVDHDRNIYVGDTNNNRIQVYTPDGALIRSWGTSGTGDGQFNHPAGIAIDLDGNVLVVDNGNHRVQRFTSEGVFLSRWGRNGGDGSAGIGFGEFTDPLDVAVDLEGYIYVTQRGLPPRVQKFMYDRDHDGLLDDWETRGVPYADGSGRYPLHDADPRHRDLYLEVDATTGYQVSVSSMESVRLALAAGPNSLFEPPNPDGIDGATLHYAVDEEVDDPKRGYWDTVKADFAQFKSEHFGTPAERVDPRAVAAKRRAYRYAVATRTFCATCAGCSECANAGCEWEHSGLAELGGNDFVVTLGPVKSIGDIRVEAGTVLHELGHTLGLRHGGVDDINGKPNYFSVMNYVWQFPTTYYGTGWALEYSSATIPTLIEESLDEPAGIGGPPGRLVPAGPPLEATGLGVLVPSQGQVDWNRDGDATDLGVSAMVSDVNTKIPVDEFYDYLESLPDWSLMYFRTLDGGLWVHDGDFCLCSDCNGTVEMDSVVFASLQRVGDCNGNGVRDDQDIAAGAIDANGNGILDGCEATVGVPPVGQPAGVKLTVRSLGGGVEIKLSLPAAANATLEVFDVFGRHCRTLRTGVVAKGESRLDWDGKGDNGARLGAGVFWIRLRTGDVVRTAKAVLRY